MDIKPDKVSLSKMNRTYDDLWNEREQILPNIEDQRAPFEMAGKITSSMETSALNGGFECTQLSKLYFSLANREEVQTRIRYEIWKVSRNRYIIDSQNEMELGIMMRSVFLQHSKNLNCNFKQQIQELNNIVVESVVPGILTRIKQYIIYLRDKSQPLQPLDRPKNTNTTGTKSLRLDRALGFN
jgi:hypothetical protein